MFTGIINSTTVTGIRIRLKPARLPITPSYVLKGPPWMGGPLRWGSTGEKNRSQEGNSGPQVQLVTVFSRCLQSSPEDLNVPARAGLAHDSTFWGYKWSPGKNHSVIKHRESPRPRLGFRFFLFPDPEVTQEGFSPLSTEQQVLPARSSKVREVRRDSQKDFKYVRKATLKEGTGRAYQCPGDGQVKAPLTGFMFAFFRPCSPRAGDHEPPPSESREILSEKVDSWSHPIIILPESQDKGPGSAFLARFPGDSFISSFKFEDPHPRVRLSEPKLRKAMTYFAYEENSCL